MFPIVAPPLLIRPMLREDAAAVQAARIHPDNARYSGWRPETVEEVAAYADAQDPAGITRDAGTVQLVIEEAGRFVGDFGVNTRGAHSTVELGINLAQAAQGRGLATRATQALVDALFEASVHRLIARVDPRNLPSVKLFERLDFRYEGRELECYWDAHYEEWTDELLYARLRREWLEARASNT